MADSLKPRGIYERSDVEVRAKEDWLRPAACCMGRNHPTWWR